MAERTLRGARIGATSLQGEHGIEFSPRRRVEYLTDRGNRFGIMFDSEAEVPPEWFDPRTHWDMLMERRSREELEELLDERLQILRERRGGADGKKG